MAQTERGRFADYIEWVEQQLGRPLDDRDEQEVRQWWEENCVLVGDWPADAKKWPW